MGDSRIDNIGENADTKIAHSNDIWRCGSTVFATSDNDTGQSWIARIADNTNSQCTTDEEDAESRIDHFECCFDIDSRTNGFGSDHGDIFGTNDGEQRR